MEGRIVESVHEALVEQEERSTTQIDLVGSNIKALNILLEDKVGVTEVRDALK